MCKDGVNHYGSLCTELYERLHARAPEDELAFYLSYARPGQRILEPLCGGGTGDFPAGAGTAAELL